MPSKRWDTYKFTLYGALAGILVLLGQVVIGQRVISFNGPDQLGEAAGTFVGSAAAGAIMCAAISGIRNLIARD